MKWCNAFGYNDFSEKCELVEKAEIGVPPDSPSLPPVCAPPSSRLNSEGLPSPLLEDVVDSEPFGTGCRHANPPPPWNCTARDEGNANPKLMRSTLYSAPKTSEMLKSSQIPFAVFVSPFAVLNENENEPPVVNVGSKGPIRCRRCKAYACRFMQFEKSGCFFKCPFCHANTLLEGPARVELLLGAYDLVAGAEYCKHGIPPKPPAFIFMIDVSSHSISNGMLPMLCYNLETVLRKLDASVRIGLATYDQTVHFYDLSSTLPKMMVMTDVEDPFVPFVDGLLLPISQALPALRAALRDIPRTFAFAPTKITDTILHSTVQAGLDALKCSDRVGKLIVFSSSPPTFDAKFKSDQSYTKLGSECVEAGVTVDLFLFPNAFIDVETIGQLSSLTGGSILTFPGFSAEKDGIRMMHDLERHLSKKIAFDCTARVRTSAGIRPISNVPLKLASIDESKAFVAELEHDGGTLSGPDAFVQTAVLYTSMNGQRRLRILNLCLPLSDDYNELYRLADSHSVATLMLKEAVELDPETVKETLSARCAQILATFRKECSPEAPPNQFILPETLKLLPLYVNSILAMIGGNELTADEKVAQTEMIRRTRTEDAMRLIYPRVTSFSKSEHPKVVRAGAEFLSSEKAYFIDNGLVLIVWIGSQLPQSLAQEVLGAVDGQHEIQMLPRGIRHRKTLIVVEGSGEEAAMRKLLVEDGSSQQSYREFIRDVHRRIRRSLE
ncbi:unnamed protein product [Caenorhabditis sp. 36 PRJEB53466]|nr:unnamed protein product [Caenorhabditis sp. 36 PRJEB53466]